MAYFQYNNKQVYYDDFGTGTPLVFLHGNTASSKMFTPILSFFKNKFRIILLDFLGHGKSDRCPVFPSDLWFDEAQQVIVLLESLNLTNVHLIGSSGGALVAINVALERPDLVNKVIADSFEGEHALSAFTQNLEEERNQSKTDHNASMFYKIMHGDDWEHVVDCDTAAIISHAKDIGSFFHKPLEELQNDILMVGTQEDRCVSTSVEYLATTYSQMLQKIGHGSFFIFSNGDHPAIISNSKLFCQVACAFLE